VNALYSALETLVGRGVVVTRSKPCRMVVNEKELPAGTCGLVIRIWSYGLLAAEVVTDRGVFVVAPENLELVQ
jgi:hypothetical protein